MKLTQIKNQSLQIPVENMSYTWAVHSMVQIILGNLSEDSAYNGNQCDKTFYIAHGENASSMTESKSSKSVSLLNNISKIKT